MLLVNLANLNQERSKFDNWVLLGGKKKRKKKKKDTRSSWYWNNNNKTSLIYTLLTDTK